MAEDPRNSRACRHLRLHRRFAAAVQVRGGHFDWLFSMLLGMIFRLYSEIFVEIQALFLEILRFEFVTLFVKHPVGGKP